jgi:hypothetical protein
MIGGPSADWLGISFIFWTPLIAIFTHYLLRPRFVPFCEVVQALDAHRSGNLLATKRSSEALSSRMMGSSEMPLERIDRPDAADNSIGLVPVQTAKP